MKIFINDTDEIITLDCLSDDYLEWESPDKKMNVQLSNTGKTEHIELQDGLVFYEDDIKIQIEEQYQDIIQKINEGIEFQDETFEPPFPYDPEKIRVEPYTFSVKETSTMIDDDDIQLNPDFQRHFVWRSPVQKSRLIESILLRIPLPVFYLSQDEDGIFQVIDGLQRLTVLGQFLNNKFSLKGLEYLKDLEGKTFSKGKTALSLKYKRRVERTQLNFNVIDPQTPTRVKFEIFKRINQGGKALNNQEIRNCMAKPRVREFIKKLTISQSFLKATGNTVSPVRMADQELILRFLGFYLIGNKNFNPPFTYSGNMGIFLDDTLDYLNKNNEIDYEYLLDMCSAAMKNAHHLFGKYAFRKYLPEDFKTAKRKKLINNSLFTSFSIVLADYDVNFIMNYNAGFMVSILASELENDKEYFESISYATSNTKQIDYAINKAKNICIKHFLG